MGLTTSLVMMGVSTALAAVGSYTSSQQQKSQLEYQNQVASNEAIVANQNADIAEEQGRQEARTGYENKLKKRQEVAGVVGSQRAIQSASGVMLDTGSFMDLQLDTVEKGEIDASIMEQAGFDNQYKYGVQAQNFRTQASSLESQSHYLGNSAGSINPFLSAGTSIVGSAANMGMSYEMMTKGANVDNSAKKKTSSSGIFTPSPNWGI